MASGEPGNRGLAGVERTVPSRRFISPTRERLMRQSENRPALRSPRRSAPVRSPEVGFLVIDSSLRPLYANAQAVHILAYPHNSRKTKSLDALLAKRIRAVVPNGGFSPQSPFPTEFVSGNRRYLCRTFFVNSPASNSSRPTMALLLERPPRESLDVSEMCQDYGLTPREREAVEYLVQGLTSREISTRMKISPNTVKAFMRLIMIKMGVSSRSGIMGKLLLKRTYHPDPKHPPMLP